MKRVFWRFSRDIDIDFSIKSHYLPIKLLSRWRRIRRTFSVKFPSVFSLSFAQLIDRLLFLATRKDDTLKSIAYTHKHRATFKYRRHRWIVERYTFICRFVYSSIWNIFFSHFYDMDTTHLHRFHSCNIILDSFLAASFAHKFTHEIEKKSWSS